MIGLLRFFALLTASVTNVSNRVLSYFPFVSWLCCVVSLACVMLQPVSDPDLWLHIVAGRWMLHNRAVISTDLWTTLGAGKPWRAYSWSNEVIFALIDRHFGVEGLLGLQLLFVFLLVLALCYGLSEVAKDYRLGLLLGSLASVGCYWHVALRPQTTAWICYALVIMVTDRIRTVGWSRKQAAQLAAVMCLWANSHLSAVLGLATIVVWLAGTPMRVLAMAVGVGFIATLFTPFGGGEWLTAFVHTTDPMRFGLIAELQPVTLLDYYIWPLLLATSVLLYSCHRSPSTLPRAVLLGWSVMFCLGLSIGRFIPFTMIFTCFSLARLWRDGHLTLPGALRMRYIASMCSSRWCSIGAGLVMLLSAYRAAGVWQQPLDLGQTPKQAVDFIEEHALARPVLGSFGSGSYLLYRSSDAIGNVHEDVAIDGRTDIVSADTWTKFHATFIGGEDWEEFITLTKPATIMWPSTSPLVRLLVASERWCLVYQDGTISGVTVLERADRWSKREVALESLNCL